MSGLVNVYTLYDGQYNRPAVIFEFTNKEAADASLSIIRNGSDVMGLLSYSHCRPKQAIAGCYTAGFMSKYFSDQKPCQYTTTDELYQRLMDLMPYKKQDFPKKDICVNELV